MKTQRQKRYTLRQLRGFVEAANEDRADLEPFTARWWRRVGRAAVTRRVSAAPRRKICHHGTETGFWCAKCEMWITRANYP